MGDLVNSERHPDPQLLHQRFNAAIIRQNDALAEDIVSPLTVTLGDEFQGLLSSTIPAAQAARRIRLELMNEEIDCRFVVGAVNLKTPLNRDRAWNMMGPGFAGARERLDEKRSPNRYRFHFPTDNVLETLLEASGRSLTSIERGWSIAQRTDITKLLEGDSVADIARMRNVTVHNVYKIRSAGDFELYTVLWEAIYKALMQIDQRLELPGAEKWSTRSFTQL